MLNASLSRTLKPSKYFKAKGSRCIHTSEYDHTAVHRKLSEKWQPHTLPSAAIDHAREGADLYLAEANTWGQALWRHGDWRQRKQLASAVICLPLRTAPRLPGPLYWHE